MFSYIFSYGEKKNLIGGHGPMAPPKYATVESIEYSDIDIGILSKSAKSMQDQ